LPSQFNGESEEVIVVARIDRATVRWERQCGDCGEMGVVDLSDGKASDFYVFKAHGTTGERGSTGLRADGVCKKCRKERTRKRQQQRPDLRQQYDKTWRDKNRERVRKTNRESEARRRPKAYVEVRPLAEWLITFIRLNADNLEFVHGEAQVAPQLVRRYRVGTIAEAGNQKVKRVEDWLRGRGHGGKIHIRDVDKILMFCQAEHMLSMLYPVHEGEETLPRVA